MQESQTLDKVLSDFLELHQHLFAVLDEYGGLAGVISLEDVLEEILAEKSWDESDVVADMREAARMRRAAPQPGKRTTRKRSQDQSGIIPACNAT